MTAVGVQIMLVPPRSFLCRKTLVVGDRCAGLVATVGSMLPTAKYQRCMVHFMRNVLSKVPPIHREWASAALKAVFAMESRESALDHAEQVAAV